MFANKTFTPVRTSHQNRWMINGKTEQLYIEEQTELQDGGKCFRRYMLKESFYPDRGDRDQ